MPFLFAQLKKTAGAVLIAVLTLTGGLGAISDARAQEGVLQPTAYTDDNEAMFTDFLVQYDQARLMRLEDDISQVIVGNPSIADVTVQGQRLLVLTGKTFGVTNLIVLNAAGEIVTNRRLIVRADDQKIVNLSRGTVRQTYNCAPNCQSILQIGDAQSYYQLIAKSSEEKFKVSEAVVEGGGQSQ